MTYLRTPRIAFHPEDDLDFEPVQISREEFLHPRNPEHYGERVLWTDGSLHDWPEDNSDVVTVLRRKSFQEPAP